MTITTHSESDLLIPSSSQETAPLLRRRKTTHFDTRRDSWCSHSSNRKDKVGDAWHNLFTGFDTGIFHYPIISLVPSMIVSLIIWNLDPLEGLTSTSMHVLAIFAGFVLALLISHYEVSCLISIALSILAITKNFMCKTEMGQLVDCHLCGTESFTCHGYKSAFQVAVSGFTSDVVWLVFCAFHIGKAVEVSGLGKRIALHLVSLMGQTPRGLALSFCFAEFLLAPFIPSNSARGGGVIAPIVTSVIDVISTSSVNSPSTNGYLILVASQANLVSSSLFLTGLAPNPVISAKAHQALNVEFGFVQWLTGSFVPGFFTLLLLPFFISLLMPPTNYDEIKILNDINIKLDNLGSMSFREWKLVLVLISCLTLWSTESYTGLNNALIGFLAMTIMMILDILTWDDISKNTKAWDTFFWLAGFIVLAEQLSLLEISDWLGTKVSILLESESITPLLATLSLAVIYFFSMYMFSSATGHIVALVGSFFEAGERLGCPSLLLIALIAYFSALSCCMTSYSTGSFAIYFGQGHVSRSNWFKIGLIMAFFYITVYLTLGLAWWKFLGWW